MSELIKIEKRKIGRYEINAVTARELYIGLGLAKDQWSRWASQNIEKNEFFMEHEDWEGFDTMSSGNKSKDYAVSIEFAKHIAMQARTEKSHQYRQYMIDCEKRVQLVLPDFSNPAIAARAWADEVEQKMLAFKKIDADKPKVEFAERVRNLDGSCTVSEFAKTIGFGRNTMYRMLREDKILMVNNLPYQQYLDDKRFEVIEQIPFTDSNGKTHPAFQTRITGKGQVWLEKKYREVAEA